MKATVQFEIDTNKTADVVAYIVERALCLDTDVIYYAKPLGPVRVSIEAEKPRIALDHGSTGKVP